jgi:hypothetical protein
MPLLGIARRAEQRLDLPLPSGSGHGVNVTPRWAGRHWRVPGRAGAGRPVNTACRHGVFPRQAARGTLRALGVPADAAVVPLLTLVDPLNKHARRSLGLALGVFASFGPADSTAQERVERAPAQPGQQAQPPSIGDAQPRPHGGLRPPSRPAPGDPDQDGRPPAHRRRAR